jgi:hypothetical protein
MFAGQSLMLAMLLARHRPLVHNSRRLVGWFRLNLFPEIIVMLVLAAVIGTLAVLTIMGPQIGASCSPQPAATIFGIQAALADFEIRQARPITPFMIAPHIGSVLFSWGSLIVSVLLLFVSLFPVRETDPS